MKTLKIVFILMCVVSMTRAGLLVDNAETGSDTNALGGPWVKFDDGFSKTTFIPNSAPGYSGAYCRLFEWSIDTGSTNPYAGVTTGLNATWAGRDLHTYFGVRFRARGNGRYDVSLATDQTRAGNNHYARSVNMTSEWALYELPFSQFAQTWGQPRPWDPTTIYSVGFAPVASFGMTGEIWIDDIEFYLEAEEHPPVDPNLILLEPKTDQRGYLPGEEKYFCIAADAASTGDKFALLDSLGLPAFSGTLVGAPTDDIASTGEQVWKADFSGLTTPGIYTASVNGRRSYPFVIGDSVYNPLLKDALRCFYLIRCGLAENDPVTGIVRPACHTADAKVRGGTGSIDATGGWHNAGDRGKFVNEAAVSVAYMLWLYELKSAALKDLEVNIPESANGIPDILDEARWGLQWLLRMQNADGTVYHKADSEPYLYHCPEPVPDQDPFDAYRYVEYQKSDLAQVPSTIDAADVAAVMSQASRVFRTIDSAFAVQCLDAAKRSWAWVIQHPGVGQTDPYYIDSVSAQEELWAEGEMAGAIDSDVLRAQFSADMDQGSPGQISWGDPQLFGYVALYRDSKTDAALKAKIRNRIVALCDAFVLAANASGYGVALRPWEYWWESNEVVLTRGSCLLFGYEVTGNAAYRKAALSQLHYMLGLNSLSKSFVAGHGSNPVRHPFNSIYNAYGVAMPGWPAGGANSYIDGADYFLADLIKAGTPKAKCFVDRSECGLGSWASNEGETSETAALIFLSGYFSAGTAGPSDGVSMGEGYRPGVVRLFQNYPNPFNPVTAISYELAVNSKVSLKVFNILGEEVATLVNEFQQAGEHTQTFHASGLPSGVYFYRLKAGPSLQTGKMIILR